MTEFGEVIYQGKEIYRPRAEVPASLRPCPTYQMTCWVNCPQPPVRLLLSLGDHIRCQASSKLNVTQFRGQLRVDGGRDLGVYRGQEFLLVPSSRGFATRGLDSALQSVAIARIERVFGQHASVNGGNWRDGRSDGRRNDCRAFGQYGFYVGSNN